MRKTLPSRGHIVLLILGLFSSCLALPRPFSLYSVRIVGGVPVTRNELPYQVSLEIYGRHSCGGSVYNRDYILTAAHCVDGYSNSYITIVAGQHSLSSNDGTEQSRSVSRIITHPSYNRLTLENDITLLRLTTPFSLNSAVASIGLNYGIISSGDAVVSGWGTTFEGGNLADILRKVTVPIISDAKCREVYGSDIKDSMICAGFDAGGKDSCQGDSGGPMTVGSGSGRSLVGIVSWGYGCGRPFYAGVYTEIFYFTGWIVNTISDNYDLEN